MNHDDALWGRLVSRRSLGLASLGIAGGALVGCGSTPSTPASPSAAGTPSTADASFPTTVIHAFGQTTINAQPTRVVSVGVTEHDFLLALGVIPVGVTDWYGDQPYATWPWERAALGSGQPTVLKNADGFQFTKVAQLKPDLLIGPNAGMERGDYDKLSKIAPTIPHAKADAAWFSPWPDLLALIAQAVGKVAEGKQLAAAVKKKFADAAAANPGFAGKKANFLQNAVYDGNLIAYQNGLSTEFLTDLGLTVPAELDAYVKKGE